MRLIGLLLVAVLAVACGGSDESSRGLSGTIAYSVVLNTAAQLAPVFVVDLKDDAPVPRQLTVLPEEASVAFDVPLAWEPNGARLLFIRQWVADDVGHYETHLINRDGSGDVIIGDKDALASQGGFDSAGRMWLMVDGSVDGGRGLTLLTPDGQRLHPEKPEACGGQQRGLAVSSASDTLAVVRFADRCGSQQIDLFEADAAATSVATPSSTLPDLGISLAITSQPWLEFNRAGDRLFYWASNALHSAKLDGSDAREEIARDRFSLAELPSLPVNLGMSAAPHTAVIVNDDVFVYSSPLSALVAVPFDESRAPVVLIPESGQTIGSAAMTWTPR